MESSHLDQDGLVNESSSSCMSVVRRTAASLRRKIPMVIAILVLVTVITVIILIRRDSVKSQAVYLEPDEVFSKYGAPPDHGKEWTCNKFNNNIQCWDGSYSYVYQSGKWVQW